MPAASDWLQVDLSAIRDAVKSLRLVNELGQTIWSRAFADEAPHQLALPLLEYKAGLYMLVADTQHGQEVQKVIVH